MRATRSLPPLVGLAASSTALAAALAIVFVRASVEVGEERFWIMPLLIFIPLFFAAMLLWTLNAMTWPLRIGIAVVALGVLPVLFVGCARLADRVYADPKTFRSVLPILIRAESLYLHAVDAEPWRRQRHEEKRVRWERAAGAEAG